jgi:hypothetical protein
MWEVNLAKGVVNSLAEGHVEGESGRRGGEKVNKP